MWGKYPLDQHPEPHSAASRALDARESTDGHPTGSVGPTRSASFPTEVKNVLTWFVHRLVATRLTDAAPQRIHLGGMQGMLLRAWRHRHYRTTLLQDSRAATVDSPWGLFPMLARIPVPSAHALAHRDRLASRPLCRSQPPPAYPGALGGPCPAAYLTRRLDATSWQPSRGPESPRRSPPRQRTDSSPYY